MYYCAVPGAKFTENLVCGFSLHASPVGKSEGNPPGDGKAWMPFRTTNDSLYFFNAHNSPPGKNNRGERLPGHLSVVGKTGAGKTTLEAELNVFASRWDPLMFCLDYNHSFENLLRALSTQYYVIEPGVSTGINLFQLEDTPELRSHLFDMVKMMTGNCTDAEESLIQHSIEAVLEHSIVENRGMSLLLQNIAATGDENCLHVRLKKWCRVCPNGPSGRYAWVCDAPGNLFDPKKFRRLAFDCTRIMKKTYIQQNPQMIEVFLSNMFFLKSRMHKTQSASMLLNIIAECWIPLSFDSTADAIKEILKAGRTRGEILMMDTQQPDDLNHSQHGAAVIQQVVTQIWLANDQAEAEAYRKFNIEGKEFDIISKLHPSSHEFLIKQGQQSTVLSFDMSDGLKYWLPLLSTTIDNGGNASIAARIREKLGTDDPRIWVSAFLDEMQRITA